VAIVLENSMLSLTIEEPGQVYKNSRFDWTGNISQILFDNKFSFCSTETTKDFDSRRHGQGLYNEFGIVHPIGYDDCAVGEKFPKIGVGLLTKTSNEAYGFFKAYEIDPFDIQIETGKEWIKFTVFPKDCRGYGIKLIKKIGLSGNSFTIEYELENTGIRKILTNEYCHNFLSVNRTNIDAHYTLRLPAEILKPSAMVEAVNPENAVVLKENAVNFNFTPEKDFFFSPLTEFRSTLGEWEISHDRIGVGMKENSDFIPETMNLWGSKHVISPELFVKIDLDPGQKLKWRRIYKFYYL
jgi:hypothetical protein